jgi:hypothetical protein
MINFQHTILKTHWGLAEHGEAQVDPLVMSQMSLDRIS